MTRSPRYYRPAEAAARAGVSVDTARRRVRDGTWRSKRVGRCRLVLAEDVDGQGPEPEADDWEVLRLREELG